MENEGLERPTIALRFAGSIPARKKAIRARNLKMCATITEAAQLSITLK